MRLRLSKGLWVALLLVLVAALSWWLQRSVETESQSSIDQVRHDPDYYMENFESTSLDEMGRPAYQLDAENMLHFPDDDSATLEKPHLIVFRGEEEFWDIRAESGLVLNKGESVILQGEVIILRVRPGHGEALQVYTSDLTVRPDEKYVETDAEVTIKDGQGVTRAVGMWADLNRRRVELLSNVRGTYVPQNN